MDDRMTTDEVATALADALDAVDGDVDVKTYADAGVLTTDAGLVLTVGDAEWQVTVVRSR